MKYYHKFLLIFLWAQILIALSNVKICSSCILEEKKALLDFKSSMNETKYPHLLLPSWIDQNEVGDCCNWEGVICSNTTRRIAELHLSFLEEHIHNLRYDYEYKWFLNLSSFLPLNNLQVLDLSYNNFGKNRFDCEELANLKNLESLELGWNYLGNRILQCVRGISSIKRLSLGRNGLVGSFPSEEISGMKKLEGLDLSINRFSGSLMSSKGGVCNMKNLVELHLEYNFFGGNIPPCLSNLTSLKYLGLGYNNLSGRIPPSVITSLVNLESLQLFLNPFEGSLPLSLFSNHSKLQKLTLGPSISGLHVDFGSLALPPPFQLTHLVLPGCNLNNEILKFLFYQKELRQVYLSHNNIVGEIPIWLLENNTRLEIILLRNNSFTGKFPSNITQRLQHLEVLDISNNEFVGQVPRNMGLFFPNLKFLNLSRNYFQGSIPESPGYLDVAYAIDLSHNNFSREVPDRIGTGCPSLSYLYLSHNNLRGNFPSGSANLSRLQVLCLDNNKFSGSISNQLSRNFELRYLDLSRNEFQGQIPSWIGNLSSMQILDLSQNQLAGSIPNDICKLSSLNFLDLSANQLNGSIPSCTSLYKLRFIHLQGNQITGLIPHSILRNSFDLRAIDFRHNRLSGGVPHDIMALSQLKVLLLGGNNLQGQIPIYICQLKELMILDFSHNTFSGQIPSCLNNISSGVIFEVLDHIWDVYRSYDNIVITKSSKISMKGLIDILETYAPEFYVPLKFQEVVDFTTKSRVNAYSGSILNYMSGIDLSCNQLTGEIPPELGDLNKTRAMNLSHNHLQGSIPSNLSMLKLIESLDLSYNKLSGQIPRELVGLTFLSTFNVSYNNLTGKTPATGQFANFDESCYRGNPNLCGSLFQRHCQSNGGTNDHSLYTDGGDENDEEIDMVALSWSFAISFVAALATLSLSLYLSPQYRRTLSSLIDAWILPRFYRRYEPRWYKSR
ncbi:OLC1v1037512C4 [Oldenlandia corymbosa var. corymbosa]|uniref:OLC1v1037512C4 n=2 Tax=Oldenlandia corymbosa var. corymbosa TaxID=529605 RepID=A0AAV1E3Q8_OLDCO|nr:OLC1v1037512C4 [Oldenlandia corymbosa var. corymbosa]